MTAARMRSMIALAVIGIALTVSWLASPPTPPAVGSRRPPVAKTAHPAGRQALPRIITLPIAREAAALNSPEQTARDDLAMLDLLLSTYRRHHHGNPVGANEEIAAALLGKNLLGVAYLPAEGPFLDHHGQLIDRWGTPYSFHALARDHMDIRSAGPDGMFWTPDDINHRPGD